MTQPRSRRTRLPLELAFDLAESLDADEVVRRLLRRAIAAVDADRGSVSWIDGDELTIVDSQDPSATPLPVGSRWPIGLQPHTQRAVTTGQPVLSGVIDVGTLSGAMADALASVRHTVSLPLVLDGDVVAILAVSRRRDVPFDDDDVAAVRDIGSVAVLALRNARLYSQAQEAARAKAAFLNLAAHELRTPLTVVSGYVSMLREGSLGMPDERWQRPLDIIAAKCAELGALVENLLLTARLEHSAIDDESAPLPLDLGEAVVDAVVRSAPRAELLGARIETSVGSQPVLAVADRDHVARILDNLVNNALSYSTGAPRVRLSVSSDGGQPQVRVEDSGDGIAEDMQERIFERFVRAETGARHTTGTGLGLAISRQLAEMGGGSLVLDWSRPGEGSRFVLRLPGTAPA